MNERSTPETNALVPQFLNGGEISDLFAHCRRIERERDEALEESLEQARLLGISGERECRIIAERDEAKRKYDTLAVENMLEVNKICNQRDEVMDILSNLSHYLSCGLGDETTTAEEYGARIREGINALLDPIVEEKEKLRKMIDLQTKIVVDLEMRLMK